MTRASRAVWRAVRDLAPLPAEPRRRGLARVGASVGRPGGARGRCRTIGARGFLDWGGGLVWLAGPATAAAHEAVEAAATGRRRHLDADARRRNRCAPRSHVLPPEPEPLARITRRVKAALDPQASSIPAACTPV